MNKAAVAVLLLAACPERLEVVEGTFRDNFDGATLAPHWLATSDAYRTAGGRLGIRYGYNHPLWLRPRLPRDAEIRFDAISKSADGDVKVELWGDGQSFAKNKGAYTSSGYVLIHGGWNNSLTVLARLNEHGKDRLVRRDMKIEPGRTYRWRVERRANTLRWWIDDQLVHEIDDPQPLEGDGHTALGFNNWESDVSFDNLEIRALNK